MVAASRPGNRRFAIEPGRSNEGREFQPARRKTGVAEKAAFEVSYDLV